MSLALWLQGLCCRHPWSRLSGASSSGGNVDRECPGPTYAHQSHQYGWPNPGEGVEGHRWPGSLCQALPSAPPICPPYWFSDLSLSTDAQTEAQKSCQSHMAGGGAELGLAQGLRRNHYLITAQGSPKDNSETHAFSMGWRSPWTLGRERGSRVKAQEVCRAPHPSVLSSLWAINIHIFNN